MDRVNEIARESDLSADDVRTCFDLFLEAQRVLDCTRTDLPFLFSDEHCDGVSQ